MSLGGLYEWPGWEANKREEWRNEVYARKKKKRRNEGNKLKKYVSRKRNLQTLKSEGSEGKSVKSISAEGSRLPGRDNAGGSTSVKVDSRIEMGRGHESRSKTGGELALI